MSDNGEDYALLTGLLFDSVRSHKDTKTLTHRQTDRQTDKSIYFRSTVARLRFDNSRLCFHPCLSLCI